ncbi:MAG: stage III sporulation protein AF [Lachnospiraceae bacterium]|nr:stage III sporulation protein AF [Lachnospiraceae bacterium]
MNEIIGLLKQVGIFMVCAQTVLHFKPHQKYDKYFKLLIGIMVMVQLMSPVFTFLGGEEFALDVELPQEWTVNSLDIGSMLEAADGIVDKYAESEIKSRLNNIDNDMADTEKLIEEDGISIEDIAVDEIKVGEGMNGTERNEALQEKERTVD